MIIVPQKIICPWCDKQIIEGPKLPDLFRCYCGTAISEPGEDSMYRNMTYTVAAEYRPSSLYPDATQNYVVNNLGLFHIVNYDTYISCDYNVGEVVPFIISLCSYKDINDVVLCEDAKIQGEDLNAITKKAAALLKRYHKLLVFS